MIELEGVPRPLLRMTDTTGERPRPGMRRVIRSLKLGHVATRTPRRVLVTRDVRRGPFGTIAASDDGETDRDDDERAPRREP